MIYDKFCALCAEKGVSVSRGATEAGISKSLVSKWKNNGTALPSPDILNKICAYFDVPVSTFLGEESAPDAPRPITDEDLMYALFDGKATPEQLEEVKKFAAYVKERDRK